MSGPPESAGPDGGHLGDLLSALVDGELTGPEAEVAQAHLAGCARCRAERDVTARVRDLVAGLPVPALPLPVRAALSGAGRRRARPVVWGCGVAAAIGLGLLAVTPPRHHVTPQVAHLVEVHVVSSSSEPVTQLAPAAVPASLGRP